MLRGADTSACGGTTQLEGPQGAGAGPGPCCWARRCRLCEGPTTAKRREWGRSMSPTGTRLDSRGASPGQRVPEVGVGAQDGCPAEDDLIQSQCRWGSQLAWGSGSVWGLWQARPCASISYPTCPQGSHFTQEPLSTCHLSQGPSWQEGPFWPGASLHPGLPPGSGGPS